MSSCSAAIPHICFHPSSFSTSIFAGNYLSAIKASFRQSIRNSNIQTIISIKAGRG